MTTKTVYCEECGCEVEATLSLERKLYKEYECPNVDEKGKPHIISKGVHPNIEKTVTRTAITVGAGAAIRTGKQVADQIANNKKLQKEAIAYLAKNQQPLTKFGVDYYVKTHGKTHGNQLVRFITKLLTGR